MATSVDLAATNSKRPGLSLKTWASRSAKPEDLGLVSSAYDIVGFRSGGETDVLVDDRSRQNTISEATYVGRWCGRNSMRRESFPQRCHCGAAPYQRRPTNPVPLEYCILRFP